MLKCKCWNTTTLKCKENKSCTSVKSNLKAAGQTDQKLFSSLSLCSWSQPSLWWRQAVQLHSSQLLCKLAWGVQGHQCRLLPPMSAGQTLWWQLWLWICQLEQWLHLSGLQDNAQTAWGNYKYTVECACANVRSSPSVNNCKLEINNMKDDAKFYYQI